MLRSRLKSMSEQQVISAQGVIEASAESIFELIADPSRQPEWDGNGNLDSAETGQRVRAVGDVFTVVLTNGKARPNEVVEFKEGALIAWKPAPVGQPLPGHLWRWELERRKDGATQVTHTYDWTALQDPTRLEKARTTTEDMLAASIDRLRALAEAA